MACCGPRRRIPRAWLVARDHKVKFSSAFATVVVERIADGIGLLALFVVILATVPIEGEVRLPWEKRLGR